jgi:hypothetical protein
LRVFNRLLALLLALLLIAGGLWALAITLARALSIGWRPGWLHFFDQSLHQDLQTLSTLQLANGRVLAAAAGLAILGLLLLLLELRPWPPLIVFLDEDETARWWLHRAAFEGMLRSLVVKETTATGARAQLRAQLRGQRRWRLRVDANASPQLRAEIEQLVRASLERLGRAGDSTIRVRIGRARRDA